MKKLDNSEKGWFIFVLVITILFFIGSIIVYFYKKDILKNGQDFNATCISINSRQDTNHDYYYEAVFEVNSPSECKGETFAVKAGYSKNNLKYTIGDKVYGKYVDYKTKKGHMFVIDDK